MPVAHETVDASTTLTVAAYAPSHLHRRNTLDLIHLWNLAVTLLARDSGLDVTFVIELEVVRHYVDLHPRNRLTLVVVVLYLLNFRLGGIVLAIHELVAPDTGLDLWDRRIRGLGNRPVTVLTLHPILLNVNDVTELDRLFRLVTSRTLRRSEVVEVIRDVEIPQCGLAVIVYTGSNSQCRIRRWGRDLWNSSLGHCFLANEAPLGDGAKSCQDRYEDPGKCESKYVYHG